MALKASRNSKLKVLLVDDHPIVRQGIAQLVSHEADLSICGEAEEGAQAVSLINSLKPDFVIVDISLKDMHGLELIKNIHLRHPRLPLLVLSMHDESLYAERALRAGAMGYIMKQEGTEKVIVAIRRVLSGRIYLSEEMDSRMVQQAVSGRDGKATSPLQRLSDRELEVFELIGKGFTSRQIASKLFISIKTVDSYRTNIKTKMKLKNAMELIQNALHWIEREKVSQP